jgi:adenylosuccinate synthase
MVKADVVLGLQYGDEAKAKCTYSLLEESDYTHVIRFNGGPNAGHTIYHDGKKIVTHQIPIGVFFDLPSIIGPGSVIDLYKLECEAEEISKFLGKDIRHLIQIDYRAHIITDEHKVLDLDGSRIGSTKSGIAYAYSDKHKREGIRYEDLDIIPFNKIDILRLFYGHTENFNIMFEGAQGFGLDIDFGDYPYVTSSHCGIAGVISSGLRPDMINRVYGIAKVYETYVGNKQFQIDDPILTALQEAGQEIGATTGRKRQCNYLNMDMLIKSCRVNQISGIVLNKIDILRHIGVYKCYYQGSLIVFENETEFTEWIRETIHDEVEKDIPVIFSDNPYSI